MDSQTIELTNLWYFFSTVPQVLGAILAIMAAFVVFNIQRMTQEIFGRSKELELFEPIGASNNLYRGIIDKYFGTTVFQLFKDFLSTQNIIGLTNLINDKAPEINKSIPKPKERDLKKYFRVDVSQNVYDPFNQGGESKFEEYSFEDFVSSLDHLRLLINGILQKYESLIRFKRITKQLYITNGIIIILLLGFFFLIPGLPNRISDSAWITSTKLLFLGISITIFSLGSIILYLIRALE